MANSLGLNTAKPRQSQKHFIYNPPYIQQKLLTPDSSQSILKLNKKQIDYKLIAWEFCLGDYQPAQKWQIDRKVRVLFSENIQHYQKITIALKNIYLQIFCFASETARLI